MSIFVKRVGFVLASFLQVLAYKPPVSKDPVNKRNFVTA